MLKRAPKEDPKARRRRLREAIYRGQRVAAFLKSEFWKADLEPLLAARATGLKVGSLWRPGGGLPSCEAVALGCAYNGGRHDENVTLLRQIRLWEAEGTAARVKMKKLLEGKGA